MMIKAVSAAALSLLFATSAWALPSSKLMTGTAADAVTQIQYNQHHNKKGPSKHYTQPKHHSGPNHRYAPGSRHAKAPPHWRRYGARPQNWQSRGCVIVGPLWFCP
jgi:hypothetical protein